MTSVPDDDVRDERLATQLEVEPLDDVTRKRLVSTAVAAAAPSRRSVPARGIAAAVVALLMVVGGIVFLVAHHDTDTRPSATPAGTPAASPRAAASAPNPSNATGAASAGGAASAAAADSTPAPVDVGDFGNLDRRANLTRLREAFAQPTRATSGANRSAALTVELAGRSCVGSLPVGTITALATGTLGTAPAIVVLTTLEDGGRSIDAVVGPAASATSGTATSTACTVRPLS